MKLIIESNNDDLDEFIEFLINQIKLKVGSTLKPDRLTSLDAQLNSSNILSQMSYKKNKKLSSYDIIMGAMDNLVYSKYKTAKYIIQINPIKKIPGTNIKYVDIINLINFGGMGISPYKIIGDTFDYFENNINYYYKIYVMW